MPIPANTLRFSIRGNLPGNEIWNCSFWLRPTGAATAPSDGTAADALLTTLKGVTHWATFKAQILANLRATGGIVEERLYCYPTTGTTAAAVAVQSDVAAGTSTGGTLPNQCAVVVTLLTGVAGRSQRGRVYLPLSGGAVSTTDGQLTNTLPTLRAELANWNKDMALLASGWAIYVVSQTRTSSLPVVQCKIDTRVDVQRRRANRQAATSSATTAMPWL